MSEKIIQKNLERWEKIQAEAKVRCQVCSVGLSDNPKYRPEIALYCADRICNCEPPFTVSFKSHEVCDLCYSMFHSLYVNYGLKDRNYFREKKDDERPVR